MIDREEYLGEVVVIDKACKPGVEDKYDDCGDPSGFESYIDVYWSDVAFQVAQSLNMTELEFYEKASYEDEVITIGNDKYEVYLEDFVGELHNTITVTYSLQDYFNYPVYNSVLYLVKLKG